MPREIEEKVLVVARQSDALNIVLALKVALEGQGAL